MAARLAFLLSSSWAILFATNEDFKKYGRDIAMQVAAASPVAATRESVDPAIIEHEMSIYKAQAAESGKPENIQEKIAYGPYGRSSTRKAA